MPDRCQLCHTVRPEGGTNHLVLNGGEMWIEFCEPCGRNTSLTNVKTGETLSVRKLFDRSPEVKGEDEPEPEK